jgi:6,7-dimethyl-8-ribityllumazine synthase
MMHTIRTIEGKLSAEGLKFALVASRFNDFIVDKLVGGALDFLLRHGASPEDITLIRVPGAFEMPLVAKKLAASGNYDGIVCLGAVIRGATPHFDYVAAEVSKGLAQTAMESGVPVGFGVLTTDFPGAGHRTCRQQGRKQGRRCRFGDARGHSRPRTALDP